MTDGIDLAGILSMVGDGDLAAKLSSALGGGNGDLAAKLSSALGDGDLAAKLSSALGDGDLAPKLSSALGDVDLAAKLGAALKNADLSALLGASGASGDGAKDANAVGVAPPSSQIGAALPSVVAALTRGGDERSAERRALLAAIRPFVSDRRKRAIDTLVGIEKLTAVLPGVK